MYQWLEELHQQSGKDADVPSEEQDGRSCNKELSYGSPKTIPQADQIRGPKKRGSFQGCHSPLRIVTSKASMTPFRISGESGGTAKKYCLSDEQLQVLACFLVWLHSRPFMQAPSSARSWKSEDWDDLSDDAPTLSESKDLGCEDVLDLSKVQLQALRRICEDENRQDSQPCTPHFGGCPKFVQDFNLADEQLQELVLYYHWYKEAFTDASSGPDSDFGLSTDKLHKLRMICEDDITPLAPIGSSAEEPETILCESGLSDAQLQNLVCFYVWSRSAVSSTSLVAEPDNEFGISCDQVEEIKKFYGWCQSRRKSAQACDPSSGLSEKHLEEHLPRHGDEPVSMDTDESLHFKVPNSVLQSQPQNLPTKGVEVYHVPITDQQVQDLVCLFIWSAAASEGADMEGCDDDLDLPPKQLEQLKTRCVEAEGQEPHALSGDVELASFAEDIGIEKGQLLTLIRYCSWTCTLEGKCFTISVTQLREARTGCEVQGLTCSWTSNNEGIIKNCNVSDERLQNLMRFYTWRCSTLSCAELDDELGLPDTDFSELIQYLSWCESRATAMKRQSSSHCSVSCDRQQMFSLMPDAAAPKTVPPTTVDGSAWNVASVQETTHESPSSIIDLKVEPLPIAVENTSTTIEPTDDLDTGLDSEALTLADSLTEKNTSCLPEAEVLAERVRTVSFNIREDSDDSTDQLRKVSHDIAEYESTCDNAQAIFPVRVRSMEFSSPLPTLNLPLLGRSPWAKGDGAPVVGTPLRDCWKVSPRLDSGPSPVKRAGSPDMRPESKEFNRGAILEGCFGSNRVKSSQVRGQMQGCFGSNRVKSSQGRGLHDDFSEDTQSLSSVEVGDSWDDSWDDTPTLESFSNRSVFFPFRAGPSRSPYGAQTFCGVSQPADTYGWAPESWQDLKASWSSWWPSRILDGLKKCSCQHQVGAVLLGEQDEDITVAL